MRNAWGWRTIARPIATRWRCPPERWAGLRSRSSIQAEQHCDLVDALPDLGLRHPPNLEAVAEVLADAHVRVQRVALEDHRDVAMTRREVGDVATSDRDLAAVTSSRPAIARSSVDLPHPDGPTSAMNSPSPMSKRDVVDRDDVAGEHLGDVAKLDLRHGAGYGYHISSQLVLTTAAECSVDSPDGRRRAGHGSRKRPGCGLREPRRPRTSSS